MHVAKIKRRHGDREYTSALVRRSIREGKRVRHETIANVSRLPEQAIAALDAALRGRALIDAEDDLRVERSLPAGHVEAVLCMMRRLELGRLIDRERSRERDLAVAMVCQRVIEPGSKLAATRALAQSTLAVELGVEGADADDLYAAMDWLLERQPRIEDRLARRHLTDGSLVLYDLSSSYFEGEQCPLARRGYSRDGRRGTLQIEYGLLCDRCGRPVAVEVFAGDLKDHQTLAAQIDKLKRRFALKRVIVVGDRGMVTKANLQALSAAEGVAWVTALKAPQLGKLVRQGHLQLGLFDQRNLVEVLDQANYPGERLVCCRNPLVAAERRRKRLALLEATEHQLEQVKRRVQAGTLRGAAEIGLAVGAVWKRYKVAKHFGLEIQDARFGYHRDQQRIDAEAALDGIYVLRTSVAEDELDGPDVVRSYKQLKEAERAFRTLKSRDLEIRPIGHRLEDRVRAHVFLCTLAYYLEWHLREAWAELLFSDEHPPTQPDPVAKASRSPQALAKAHTQRTTRREPCHTFRSLLAELKLRVRNTIRIERTEARFDRLTEPTPLQARALELAKTTNIA
jgi:transposase